MWSRPCGSSCRTCSRSASGGLEAWMMELRTRELRTRGLRILATALALGLAASCGASAQTADEFYRNKQVRLIVGHPVGNDHDVGGRLLARHLGKHIPGRPAV